MKSCFISATILFFLINTFAQKTDVLAPQKPIYFPLKKGNEWLYFSKTYMHGITDINDPSAISDTFYYHITDTTTIEKKKYFVLYNNKIAIRIIRFDKLSGNYYSREKVIDQNNYNSEKLFLKNNLNPANSWSSGKIYFKVLSIKKDTIINDVYYKNVVEIRESIFNKKINKNIHTWHW